MPIKLSADTLAVLKNFATINANLVVKPGSVLSTIAEAKNILAEAKVAESFPQEFGIYDLNQFLSAIALIDDPSIEFTADSALLSDASTEIKYRFANKSVLTAPQKEIKMPAVDLTVTISEATLGKIRKAAGALGHSVLSVSENKGNITLTVLDPKDASANQYTITADATSLKDFTFQFLIANLKLVPGDYKVEISQKLISKWTHASLPVSYFIALEKTSEASK